MTTQSIALSRNARSIAYWSSTAFAALAFGVTGVADVVRAPEIMQGLSHLGYPAYFAGILGTWAILGAAAILVPDISKLQEWAYAGMFFTLTGAAISHAASGDPVGKVLVPLVVLAAVLTSWSLRRHER